MHDTPLGGKGILVTRPRAQSATLSRAIEHRGGIAVAYPVIEIAPHDAKQVAQAAAELPQADIAIFVSRNAAELGARYIESTGTESTSIAAIGPATAEALAAVGRPADIVPRKGFDSESLLTAPIFQEVGGKHIWIVRGDSGRELLAETLRARGAQIHYLSAYRRQKPAIEPAEQEQLRSLWFDGGIDAVTAMSVESLHNLIELLPDQCSLDLARLPLVTPATRVIKELLNRYPSAKPVLAADPSADAMLDAIQSVLQMDPDT